MKRRIFNVPASVSFTDVLAESFLNEYRRNPLELAKVLFLLPNRRACQALKEAFVRAQGLVPTLLPRMVPLGDVEEDELFISGFDYSGVLPRLKPAIDSGRRLLWFVRKIAGRPKVFGLEKFSAEQACYLAQELVKLIDAVYNENLSFENLQNLVPEEYARHWLETLNFLKLITEEWPAFLEERGLCDPTQRRNLLWNMQSEMWEQNPPQNRVVLAGTTATFPALKRMTKAVLNMPQGEVVLSGLDKFCDEESWQAADEAHPQYELRQLLEYLQVKREEVTDLVPPANVLREKLVSEVMRPAKTTDKWRNLAGREINEKALDGLAVINCRDVREEALSVAILMREVLLVPEKTAALVTTNRNFARRVAAELGRWNVKVDDSAGLPLAQTPVGIFLRLIVEVCEKDFSPAEFLGLLKHPFAACGREYGEVRRQVRDYEKQVLRADDEQAANPADFPIVMQLREETEKLRAMICHTRTDFKELLALHVKTAEKLATTVDVEGAAVLWKGDAGEAAAAFLAELYDNADELGGIDGTEYAGLLRALMTGIMVRPRYGTHPRLKILGPIEARLTQFDVTIVGEVNENSWPKAAEADPWMSRPMKKDFGMPLPEKTIGILAADFARLLCCGKVYLTRADRVQGTPMVKSRWWLRLETVLKALGCDIESITERRYGAGAAFWEKPSGFYPLQPPAPVPPVKARPRRLSVSAIENLMRDPYIIFAKYILKLNPLNELEKGLDFTDYGNIVHRVLERFNRKYPEAFPDNAREELLRLGEAYFNEGMDPEVRAFWQPNFEKSADWLVKTEREYRKNIKRVYSEISGELTFQAPEGDFTVTAKADRIDVDADGRINVIDYKTGQARTKNEMLKGYAPQLPLEGLIAEHGGYKEIGQREAAKLIYWQLGKKETVFEENIGEMLVHTFERVHQLAAVFDLPTTPYICQPNPAYAPKYSDYLHLARVAEWSVTEEGGE